MAHEWRPVEGSGSEVVAAVGGGGGARQVVVMATEGGGVGCGGYVGEPEGGEPGGYGRGIREWRCPWWSRSL